MPSQFTAGPTRRRDLGGRKLCPSCAPFCLCLQKIKRGCIDALLRCLTGLNASERLLSGESAADLIFYPRIARRSVTVSCDIIRKLEFELRRKLPPAEFDILVSSTSSGRDSRTENGSSDAFAYRPTPEDALLAVANKLDIDSKFYDPLRTCVTELRRARASRRAIEELRVLPYDDERDTPKLIEVLQILVPDTNSTSSDGVERVEKPDFSQIGFQHSPSSDVRSVGALGVFCLHHFATNFRPRAIALFTDSKGDGAAWFPYAITGLNVVAWLVEFLHAGELDLFFYRNTGSSLDTFAVLFAFTFVEFGRFWKLQRPTDVFQFGKVSQLFVEEMRRRLAHESLSEGSEWTVLRRSTGENLVTELKAWIEGEYCRVGSKFAASSSRLV